MNTKYIWLLIILLGFTACNTEEDILKDNLIDTSVAVLPDLTAGTADFSKYVSIGNSLTAGFADNALYAVGQMNSFPNLLSQKFALVGGGAFTQPMMDDNVGGLLFGGVPNPAFAPRLYFNTATSSPEVVSGTPSTEVFAPASGSYNNMGVPGAAVGHLLYDGYGNPANLATDPATANPYFVRMASAPNTTILADAMAQSPTFFSLWIGSNDVLGYALSGGDGTAPITPISGPLGIGFTETYNYILGALVSTGAKGIVANIPDITSIPHFTTVPYNPVPLDATTATALNNGYSQYNGGLQLALANGLIDADEAVKRTITFSEGEGNALVIIDEYLTDLSGLGLPNFRQATANDLLLLALSSLIPQGYGTQIQLEDKWVLTPEEQTEIVNATAAFNQVIDTARQQAGLALLDANTLMTLLANGGVPSGDFTLTSGFVTGGMFSLDGVHPNSRGYSLIANEIMKAIDETYGSNFEASGSLYNVGDFPTNYPNGI